MCCRGLGKTLQTISLIAHLKYGLRLGGACLVVSPLSVLSTWCAELKRWAPSLRCVKLHSSDPSERERLKAVVLDEVGSYDVVVTTYEMVKSAALRSVLVQKIHWRLLVLDEGHVLKNTETEISQTVRKMHFVSALLLTGTPLQNNLTELWALLNLLYPEVFTTATVFDEGFSIQHAKLSSETLEEAHKLLQLLMLRRLKENVVATLPPKLETLVSCPLAEAQVRRPTALPDCPQPLPTTLPAPPALCTPASPLHTHASLIRAPSLLPVAPLLPSPRCSHHTHHSPRANDSLLVPPPPSSRRLCSAPVLGASARPAPSLSALLVPPASAQGFDGTLVGGDGRRGRLERPGGRRHADKWLGQVQVADEPAHAAPQVLRPSLSFRRRRGRSR